MSEFHIVEYDEVAKKIEEVKEYSNFLPDVSTDEGYQKSKRVSLDIGKILTTLEKTRKDKKAYFIEGGKAVDAQAKAIAKKLEEMQFPHKEAYKELDNLKKAREAERKQKLEDRVSYIRNLPEMLSESSSDEIKQAMNHLMTETCEDFYEFTAAALKARNESQKQLADLFSKTLQAEKDAEELAKLRAEQAKREQEEREKAIADAARLEAENKAKKAQEAIELEKQRAIEQEEKAKQALIDAEKAAEQAEKQRVIDAQLAEEKRLADIEAAKQAEILRQQQQAEAERLEAEKREANKKHQAKIHNAILKVLFDNGISEEDAKTMITLAAKKQLPNLTINY